LSSVPRYKTKQFPVRPAIMCLLIVAGFAGLCGSCATPPQRPPSEIVESSTNTGWDEIPVPDGPWRPHVLDRCRSFLTEEGISRQQEVCLAACRSLFLEREGSDAMMELELGLQEYGRCGLILITLGQLYMMAGQGEPMLLPSEGPAADVGNWPKNKKRLLSRADQLLTEAAQIRPEDAMVDYLLADIARAQGDTANARLLIGSGWQKCPLPRSMAILQQYQLLNRYPAQILKGMAPDYPQTALENGITGKVILDLLISPAGQIKQFVTIVSPHPSLTRAAKAALKNTKIRPTKIGKYPLWSWLRTETQFNLED